MPAFGRKINLLPPSEFELSFWGRFLSWAVTTGRYIIILTELVVICAFLSRFKLDNDIANLNSEIEGKKNVQESNMALEKEFRMVQAKAAAVEQTIQYRIEQTEIMDEISKNIPEEVKLQSLDIRRNTYKLSARTNSETAIGKMLTAMSQSGKWKEVILSQIFANKEKGITFTLEMKN